MRFHSLISILVSTPLINAFLAPNFVMLKRREIHLNLQQGKHIEKTVADFAILLLISGALMSFPMVSNAQIPDMDEYNTGSGTVLPGRAKNGKPLVAKVVLKPEIFTVDLMKSSLLQMDGFLTQEPAKWDEITQVIKKIPKLTSKNLGFSSSSDLASNFKIPVAQAEVVESAREELAFNVGQLKDLALANRVYAFNKADLAQQELIKDADSSSAVSPAVAKKEGIEIMKEIRLSLTSVEEALISQ